MNSENQNIQQPLSVTDKKIIYRARRGLKELDFYIDPYVKNHFVNADAEEKATFAVLVEQEDPDLLNWFMDIEQPDNQDLSLLIQKIKSLKQF